MCTLAIYRDVSDQYPLVVAANRDEFLSRAAVAPGRFSELPDAVGGRDLEARGTWLGCRVDGPPLVAGLLNRRSETVAQPSPAGRRSRGLLCLDALGCRSVAEVLERVDAAEANRYGPFNLLLADRHRAVVVDNGSGVRATELATGLSLLTNLDVNDPRCPRLASAVTGFETVTDVLAGDVSLDVVVNAFAEVLSNHENSLDPTDNNPLARVCIHGNEYGTRSSSIIAVEADGRAHYFHADGPPCRTPFQRVAY